jgi:hypothetical protein
VLFLDVIDRETKGIFWAQDHKLLDALWRIQGGIGSSMHVLPPFSTAWGHRSFAKIAKLACHATGKTLFNWSAKPHLVKASESYRDLTPKRRKNIQV